MRQVFHCRDMGMACDYVARAENESDLIAQVKDHAKTAHDIKEITRETLAKIRLAIRKE